MRPEPLFSYTDPLLCCYNVSLLNVNTRVILSSLNINRLI